ncbi:IclR family transcriptional regulator [Priestia megaterium]|uniref:IclR family transcriptional regulator n=1 Tax=Priestia megaterium TaxID=1404 RepID=UPI00177D982F|nr:IclR family transcriptional regulator [Priestia megaterium]MBD8847889.1 IclR family transcriptional regulator [Priestia megaterium]MCF6799803.1 IclR family transcriptional regulator [Bacillus sp. ET1]MDN4866014.1 IclR family transcriptional regulator [Priestia megaterium]MED4184246.1 IclR family transcriptional regulator [Priestia megaterium]
MVKGDTVQSVDRALAILGIVSQHNQIGITDICKSLDLNKTTVYRLLSTLMNNGYIEQVKGSNKYRCTFKLFEMGNKRIQDLDLLEEAKPALEKLADLTKETVHLVVEEGTEIVYIHKVESTNTIRMHTWVGKKNPMYRTAVGKAILAFSDKEKAIDIWNKSEIVQNTPYTITNLDDFLEQLVLVRKNGYAIDNEETEIGIRCVAAPILDFSKNVIGALSISIPTIRFPENEIEVYGNHVKKCSEVISKKLGYIY